ncbi:DUF1798 family protein [Pontibacillus litoralis]|uniref:DUF1798 family protein n=1 Tax=Pontibacillus litoralis JSM 072002 TaxID=1385512 RepID=A0A0A5G9Y5_9BACI|nr:DUF1798 family protein [Pontibacillus litoralis]KGX87930.1 hypothetical protein N784_12570 [Pontibacillus litoralis JSM 072002]
MDHTLQKLIYDVKQRLDKLKAQYLLLDKPSDKKDRALFEKVKRETDPLFTLIQQWYDESIQYSKMNAHTNVFPIQLQNTKDNFELVLMHSYYIDVPKKRYMELYHSIHYVLNQQLDDLQ